MVSLAISDFLSGEPSLYHLVKTTVITLLSHKNPCPQRSRKTSKNDCSPPHTHLKQDGTKYPRVLKEGTVGLSLRKYEIILHLCYINDISLKCEINVPYVNMYPHWWEQEKATKSTSRIISEKFENGCYTNHTNTIKWWHFSFVNKARLLIKEKDL